jgi:hypothetical protein
VPPPGKFRASFQCTRSLFFARKERRCNRSKKLSLTICEDPPSSEAASRGRRPGYLCCPCFSPSGRAALWPSASFFLRSLWAYAFDFYRVSSVLISVVFLSLLTVMFSGLFGAFSTTVTYGLLNDWFRDNRDEAMSFVQTLNGSFTFVYISFLSVQ